MHHYLLSVGHPSFEVSVNNTHKYLVRVLICLRYVCATIAGMRPAKNVNNRLNTNTRKQGKKK